jgi:hypothetical protein
MPIIPDAVGKGSPSKDRKAKAPVTRVRSGGKVGQRLKMLADMYLRTRPEEDVRFVYSPEHKPELSNVTSRHIDGYRMCYVKDLGDDVAEMLPGMKPDDPVRVGDVVMMAIAASIRQEIQAGLDDSAAEEMGRVQEEFYNAVEEMELKKGMRPEYRARPRGVSVTEHVEREVEGPESHKET